MAPVAAGEAADGLSLLDLQSGGDLGLEVGEGLAPESLGPDASLGPADDAGLGAAEVVYPNLGSQLSELAVATAAAGDAALGPSLDGGANGTGSVESLLLTILLDGNRDGVLEFLADHGVTPANTVGDYLEVYLPPALLGSLAQQAGVSWVRETPTPFRERGDVVGQGARAHGALVWHANGWTGDSVKVGVIDSAQTYRSKDGFTGLRALMGTDLPATAVGRCYTDVGKPTSDLANCDTAGGQDHGTTVAEALMDVAPDADLYVANPVTWADIHNTVVWMHGQGVKVINLSMGWQWHGAADGTSPITPSPLNTVKWAADNGITWVNAAGNQEKLVWYGAFADADSDGWHEWGADGSTSSPDEAQMLLMRRGSHAYIEVRWDDAWGGAARDLDVEVRYSSSNNGAQTVVARSADVQNGGASHLPWEGLSLSAQAHGYYWVYLKKKPASATPSWVQFRVFDAGRSRIKHYTTGASIATPADSASPGVLAVGAAHPNAFGTLALEPYSGRGPTPDGRTKPDVVGIGCAPTSASLQSCGTSLAAPHVAGLAALVLQRNPAFTSAQVAAYLESHAADHGEPGVDNLWGAGFAELPPDGLTLPAVACTAVLAGSGTVAGAWDQYCVSDAEAGVLGRWYSFALDSQRSVTIEVSSAAGTLVRLRRGGDARRGPSLYAVAGHSGRPARISAADLPADDYTIEVVSERPGRVGSFDVSVSGVPTLIPSGSQISIAAGADVTEGADAIFTVSASPPPSAPLTVWVNTTGSGAFGAAEGRQPVTVSTSGSGTLALSTADDSADEPDGSVTATVDASPRYTASESAGATTVAVSDNDDALPPPVPGDDCVSALTGNGSLEAAWTGDCDSNRQHHNHPILRRRSYHARYYTFTLDSPSRVTIDLESAWESLPEWVDNYLYLSSGTGTKDGSELVQNDDGGDRHFDARIDTQLAAGDYTIEATTVHDSVTSRFRLTVTGLPDAASPVPVSDDDDAPAGYTVDPQVVAKVRALAAQSQHGSAHVNRWNRVLVAFGEHDGAGVSGGAMSAAQARQMADTYSSPVWDEVVAELTALESSVQPTPPTPPVVSVTADGDVTEGGDAVFTVSASPAPSANLDVSVTVSAAGDFGASTGARTVTISAGAASATLTVPTTDDAADEPDGSVTAAVDAGTQYTVSATQGSASVTVADDDDPVLLPVVSVSGMGGGVVEGRTVWFAVSAVPAPVVADVVLVGVEVSVSGDVVAVGEDAVWVTSGRVLVPVGTVNDLVAGSGGSVSLRLLAGEGYVLGADVSASVAVSDDDGGGGSGPLAEVAAVGGGVFEGEDAVFSVSVPAAVSAPLSVTVQVSGVQVSGVSGGRRTVVIAAGQSSGVLRVGTSDDAIFGGHGTVEAAVASGAGYRPGLGSVAAVSVLDDDIEGLSVSKVSITGGGTVTEGEQAVFTLSASPPPAWDIKAMVDVEVRDGDGRLVSTRTETVAIAAGTTTATLRAAAADDTADNAGHGTVTATITRGHALDYRYGSPLSAAVTVTDDDDPPPPPPPAVSACAPGVLPTLSISSPQASRSDATVDFEITLDCITSRAVPVLVAALRDGSLGDNTLVSFSAGQTTATVTVDTGTEQQLGLTFVWGPGVANRSETTGNVNYTN